LFQISNEKGGIFQSAREQWKWKETRKSIFHAIGDAFSRPFHSLEKDIPSLSSFAIERLKIQAPMKIINIGDELIWPVV
jgi:hypothetical protein